MRLYDETGQALAGGAPGFRVYDENGNLVASSSGTGTPGPKGDKGDTGDPGSPGTLGTPGTPGAAATISVGSVVTLPAGSFASITNAGTSGAAVFNFSIPQGADGTPGAAGVLHWLGDLTSAPSTPAVNDAYHNTTLGKSYVWTGAAWGVIAQDGGPGTPGSPGTPGAPGPGVPTGGTAGQVLAKIDGTDFNTQWVTSSSGGTDFLTVQVFS